MNHKWTILTLTETDESYMCDVCGLIDEPPLETECTGPRYKSSNNRQEPDEEILRALGHNLEDV